ncbi:hypothetical protein [uncultured Aquimarina sp.]|uniref:hypothetical protein n=1 Tax=uncultured Aquimarina sp. TaxID=575652 RepID=UPI002612FEC9|nr:hypothetical protein [uncultured Aquimarina sp.]
MKRNNTKIRLWYIFIGSSTALLLNYFVVEKILIPDPCYYHINKISKLMNLLYDFPTYAGGHPVPSLFNLIFATFLGGTIGLMVYKLICYIKSKIIIRKS